MALRKGRLEQRGVKTTRPWLYYDKAIDWVAQLIIVMPAANAASERSFSVLRRIRAGAI